VSSACRSPWRSDGAACAAPFRAVLLGQRRRAVAQALPGEALSVAVTVGTALILAIALTRHRIGPGAFVALFSAVGRLSAAMWGLSYHAGQVGARALEAGCVREFLALPAEEVDLGSTAATRPFPNPLRRGIDLVGVTFTYPGRDAPVLQALDLHLAPGEHLALVGRNGAGKSTLVKILLGLYRPQAGTVSADGLDYRAIDPESLRDGVSAAYQDYYNFALTARESVGVGRVAASGDLERVTAAARLGGADGFIRALPRSYDTPLGHVLDGGTGLSGGQWQRIAISRALMRQPQLLILDEPAAALDPRAEAELYGRFGTLLRGRGALLISHRLGSARLADRILVLEGGRIVEDGPHDALLALGGVYARMWEEQSQWYR